MEKLNLNELRKRKKTKIISTEESLEDIIPIEWSEKVLNGEEEIEIK
jgi:hypothetical protein